MLTAARWFKKDVKEVAVASLNARPRNVPGGADENHAGNQTRQTTYAPKIEHVLC
jgi:hypothetical protein